MVNEHVIAEMNRVPNDLPAKFQTALRDLDAKAVEVAMQQLDLQPGGLNPAGDQFGKSPLRLNFFNLGTTSGTAQTWNRTFSNRGWNTFINNTSMDDVVIAIAGLQLPNATQRIAAHQWTISGKAQTVIEHQAEIMGYENPVILYERGLVIPKKTQVVLDLLIQESGGNHMVKPFGWAYVDPAILTKKNPV